jgi:CheY-like chemotaxis protein
MGYATVYQSFPARVESAEKPEFLPKAASQSEDHYMLIVDDDPDARLVLKQVAKTLSLTSKEAHNGLDALEQINLSRPDLILLDLMMPLMDGFQVLSRLRSDSRTRSIPVIVITGMKDGMEMLQLPGVAKVLVKGSFSITTLRDILIQMLGLNDPSTRSGK